MPKVTLLHYTPLEVADRAIGKCWDKQSPAGTCNTERIERVANKNKHASTIEHLSYSFDIDGISRACLQELARHRISSFSVKSTRYTLKELKNEESMWFDAPKDCPWEVGYKYLIKVNSVVDSHNIHQLAMIQNALRKGMSNDEAKYMLPEAYKTSLVWTINARSLQNFLSLRTSKAALWEIRDLALAIYDILPSSHQFLFKDYLS